MEKDRVDSLADWYLEEQLDFDKLLIQMRYHSLKCHLTGSAGLELGPADGTMTRLLVNDFDSLTVVDAAQKLLEEIPESDNLHKVHSLFEDYSPERKFDTIVLEHILEHVEFPVELLKRAKSWLSDGGKLLIGVPNGHSIHRLVAVKMNLLDHPCQQNDRDRALGHRRVYTQETLKEHIDEAGLTLLKMDGVFFKPLSNGQIQEQWTPEMINGFYELGKDMPEYAAELLAVCSL